MFLIIGLGNPGLQYAKTRHNAGFLCLDAIHKKIGAGEWKLNKKFHSLVSEASLDGKKILLVKPETFMNASGKSASALYNFYLRDDGGQEKLWLVYDDIDLPLGKIRIRKDGSAGTHNGMKSVIESLGFQNFPRVRIGIESRGVSSPAEQETASFVLESFRKEERAVMQKTIEKTAEALLLAIGKGIAKAMDKYNI